MSHGIQCAFQRHAGHQKMAEHVGRGSEILTGDQAPKSGNAKQEG